MQTAHDIEQVRPTQEGQNQKAFAGLGVWALAVLAAALSNVWTQPFFDMVAPDPGVASCFALVCDAFVALIVIAGASSVGKRLGPHFMRRLW